MMTKLAITCATALVSLLLVAQQPDINLRVSGGVKPAIAVIDFRGSGDAQRYMDTFNQTLWDELAGSGILRMVAKSLYPLNVPQRPEDFRPPTQIPGTRRGEAAHAQSNGPWLTDWSNPPVSANDLAFGYTAVQDGRLFLSGYLFNVTQADVAGAQVFGKRYFGALSNDGAKEVARQFAADILQQFGAKSLAGSKIYFVSDRTGAKEIWSMDYDGSNQSQITRYKSTSTMPAVSPDGKMVAFTTYAQGNPKIMIFSTDTARRIPFYNPVSSVVETPEFTPDGQHMLFSATIDGWTQICEANVDGSNMRRISHVRSIEVSAKVNPKNPSQVVYISGKSGHQQLWRMNIDGGDQEMITSGEGDVANPSWSPNGQFLAFAWTRGYEIGGFNIFVMDVARHDIVQLTHGQGRNENPWWGPDGVHLVFTSKRGSATQVYTMLADGTHQQQLTTQGNNIQPVWAKGLN